MFGFAIACVPFEMPVGISNILAHPSFEERRYCPVLTARGRHTQYLKHEQPYSALVVKPSVLYGAHTTDLSFSFNWAAMFRRYDDIVITEEKVGSNDDGDIPWDLFEYIQDVIPEYKPEDIEHAVAFHNVTEEELPSCWHETGMTLTWNDRFVPKDHHARKHCGEGPFLVLRDESYLVAFTRETENRNKLSGMKVGSDRLVLESMENHRIVIAHGGYFNHIEVSLEQAYPKVTGHIRVSVGNFSDIEDHRRAA